MTTKKASLYKTARIASEVEGFQVGQMRPKGGEMNCPYCGEATCENPAACNQAARVEQEPDEPEEENHDVECPINCRLCEEKLAEYEAEADAAQQAAFYGWGTV